MSGKPFSGSVNTLAFPLSEHYKQLELPLPDFIAVDPSEIAEPYRALLVHDRDLTPTLEAAYGQPIHLRVLRYEASADVVRRLVVLVLDGDETPVSMGAIQIFLEHLPPEARRLVEGRREALGSILHSTKVSHYSRPEAFFRVVPDRMIANALSTNSAPVLYGRRNTLRSATGASLAEVVEILAPSIHL